MSSLNLLTEVSPRKLSQCSTQNSSGMPLSKTVSPLSATREAQAADFSSPFVDRKAAGSESNEIQIESQPEDDPAETRWQENAKELLQPKQEGESPQDDLLRKLDPSWWSFISPKLFSPEQTKLSQTSQQPKKLSVITAPPVASRNKGNGSVEDSMGEAHKFLLGEEAMEKIPPPSSRSALQHASHKPPHAAKVRPIADPKGSSANQNGRRDVRAVAEEVDAAESIAAPAAVRSEQEEGGPAEKPTGEPRQPVFSRRRSIWPRPVQQPSKTNYQGRLVTVVG